MVISDSSNTLMFLNTHRITQKTHSLENTQGCFQKYHLIFTENFCVLLNFNKCNFKFLFKFRSISFLSHITLPFHLIKSFCNLSYLNQHKLNIQVNNNLKEREYFNVYLWFIIAGKHAAIVPFNKQIIYHCVLTLIKLCCAIFIPKLTRGTSATS